MNFDKILSFHFQSYNNNLLQKGKATKESIYFIINLSFTNSLYQTFLSVYGFRQIIKLLQVGSLIDIEKNKCTNLFNH